ncbi:MAG: HipA domain-containing protein [Candidatus Baltobacteraceae bacterium]
MGVWLADRPVGTLINLPGDDNLFSFHDAYLDDEHPPVLSQGFITATGTTIRRVPRTHRVTPPFFANLLPDEDGVLRSIVARQFDINRTRDYPFLHVLGEDLPGAVIIRELDAPEEEPAVGEPRVPSDRPLRFSLAGAQLKFSANSVANRLTIPLRGTDGQWIVKLPTNAYPRLPENEYAIMRFAKAVGLDVPDIDLVELDQIDGLPRDLPLLRTDEPPKAFKTRRFDRTRGGGRVHFEDLNQVAGQAPRDKYEGKATHWVANVIATLCPPEDLEEFVRRLVFGVCTGNNDMHLKNWSIGYRDGYNARISPLYDFVCTRLYYPNGDLVLTVGGERDFARIDRDALRAFAVAAEISVRQTAVLANQLVERLRETWNSFKVTISDASLVAALERNFSLVPLMRSRAHY